MAVSLRSGLSQHVYMTLQMNETGYNKETNTSTVAWALKGWLEANNSAYWYSQNYHAITVTINGTTVFSRAATTAALISIGTTNTSEASALTIAEGSITVAHDSDGTKTIAGSFSCAYRWSGGSWSANGSMKLTDIPRASSVSCGTLTMGTAGTITITKADSNFKHTLIFNWGDTTSTGLSSGKGYSETIASLTTATSVTWTPPLKFANIIPTASQGQGSLVCKTYNSSGTYIGEKAIVVTVKVPDNSSTKPSLNISVARVRTTNTDITGYIQNVDRVTVTLNASAKYGASITGYTATVGGVGYSGQTFTTNTLTTSGTVTITATVTDSKGYSTTASTSITVTAYTAPQITKLEAYRVASDSSTTAATEGAYICVKPTASVTALSNTNTITCTIYYKKSTATSWTSTTLATSSSTDYAYNGEYKIFSADVNSAFDVKATVTDAFNSTTSMAKQVPTKGAFISILKSGASKVAMAIGKVAETANRFTLGWGLVVQASSNRDTDGTDIYVKNSGVAGVRALETTSNAGVGLVVDSNKNRGLWDVSTGDWLLRKDSGNTTYIPSRTCFTWGNVVSNIYNGSSNTGYMHFAKIVLKSTYQDEPFVFEVIERFGQAVGQIVLNFIGQAATDPAVDTLYTYGGITTTAYAIHTATNTWDLYLQTKSWNELTLIRVARANQLTASAVITYPGEFVTSLPSGTQTASTMITSYGKTNSVSILGGKTTFVPGGIELFGQNTPYIDFHYAGSTADYTARIIENSKGVLTAYNSIANGSDARLKENITDVDDKYMQLVERLQAKTFHMKAMDEGTLSCGFVAQDVLAIEKELGIEQSVLVRNDGQEVLDLNNPEKVNINYYAIDYQAYAVLLGEYYRRQFEKLNLSLENSNKAVEELAARVEALEGTKDELKAEDEA